VVLKRLNRWCNTRDNLEFRRGLYSFIALLLPCKDIRINEGAKSKHPILGLTKKWPLV
jgi:hypothetical protein